MLIEELKMQIVIGSLKKYQYKCIVKNKANCTHVHKLAYREYLKFIKNKNN